MFNQQRIRPSDRTSIVVIVSKKTQAGSSPTLFYPEALNLAEEHREDWWKSVVVHIGDVTPLFDDSFGLDVLSTESEFEAIRTLADSVSFDTSHVYHGGEGNVGFLLIAVEASAERRVVLVPAYLSLEAARRLETRSREEGAMYTHVRPLSDDARVTFTHEDPEPFF